MRLATPSSIIECRNKSQCSQNLSFQPLKVRQVAQDFICEKSQDLATVLQYSHLQLINCAVLHVEIKGRKVELQEKKKEVGKIHRKYPNVRTINDKAVLLWGRTLFSNQSILYVSFAICCHLCFHVFIISKVLSTVSMIILDFGIRMEYFDINIF